MEGNGAVTPTDVATLSLLGGGYGGYGRGYGGHGGGYGGGLYSGNQVLAANAHADGTAIGVGIKNNADLVRQQGDRFADITRADQFSSLGMGIARARNDITRFSEINRLEQVRIAGDNRVELSQLIGGVKSDLAACCCATQKLILEENGKTRELINASSLKEAERELDRSDRRANSSDIATAMSNQTAVLAGIINQACNDNGHGHGRGRGFDNPGQGQGPN